MKTAATKLEVKNLHKVFSVRESYSRMLEITALDDINLRVYDGEFVSLLGPSGCGKSTLLMIVAGLYDMTSGEVLLDGAPVQGPGFDRGVVFQEFAVFPWLTVAGNVRFGLRMKGAPKDERDAIVTRLLDVMQLSEFRDVYPHRLSGGMKQRVGIARALALDPEILLMDEPFGALDAQTRSSLQRPVVEVWTKTRKTVVFVTHSVREATFLSDRVIVMTPRPGHVAKEISIDLPRPRDPLSVEFLSSERELAEVLAEVSGAEEGEQAYVTD